MESLLFANSQMLSVDDIKNFFNFAQIDITPSEIKKIIQMLSDRYSKEDSGLEILEIENKYQLVTKKKNYELISKMLTPIKKKSLTQSALETLTIIAYNEPVTKNFIEKIKGIKSDTTINTLLEYGLIENCGKLDTLGRPNIYKTTALFLKYIGISSLSELPEYNEFREKVSSLQESF